MTTIANISYRTTTNKGELYKIGSNKQCTFLSAYTEEKAWEQKDHGRFAEKRFRASVDVLDLSRHELSLLNFYFYFF